MPSQLSCVSGRSPTILKFLPEYLFDKKTIRQQQKAMSARVEKLARAVSTKTELEKELYITIYL